MDDEELSTFNDKGDDEKLSTFNDKGSFAKRMMPLSAIMYTKHNMIETALLRSNHIPII